MAKLVLFIQGAPNKQSIMEYRIDEASGNRLVDACNSTSGLASAGEITAILTEAFRTIETMKIEPVLAKPIPKPALLTTISDAVAAMTSHPEEVIAGLKDGIFRFDLDAMSVEMAHATA
jgi:hypothetical protein